MKWKLIRTLMSLVGFIHPDQPDQGSPVIHTACGVRTPTKVHCRATLHLQADILASLWPCSITVDMPSDHWALSYPGHHHQP